MQKALYVILCSIFSCSHAFEVQSQPPSKDSVQLAINQIVQAVYQEKNPAQKEKLYRELVVKFPPDPAARYTITYDYACHAVAKAYAKTSNVDKAMEYADMIQRPFWKGEGWAGIAQVLLDNGHTKEAAALYKKAYENSLKYATTHRNDEGASFARTGLPYYRKSLLSIYLSQKEYQNALPYIKAIYDSTKPIDAEVSSMYAETLIGLNQNHEAFRVIDEAAKEGQTTTEMKLALKTLYPKVKGSAAGYDAYTAALTQKFKTAVRMDLEKKIIKIPAPVFTLTDVDGNAVTLADLRGKIIVLDFWATWCAPCKKSFPSMKKAMDRLHSDKDVRFLFIHTMERDKDASQAAKNYVLENNFPFHVLMDLKDANGVNQVARDYKVSGIPTKFVIDKQGNIRFTFLGFSGSEDAAVEEIEAMVELSRN